MICPPSFPAQLLGLDASYNIEVESTFVFRPCVDGEILVDNQCRECPPGSYSFRYDPLHPTTQYTVCPAFTDCQGSNILVSPGYWRFSNTSTEMSKCPFGKAACHGGSGEKSAKALGLSVFSYAATPTIAPAGSANTTDDSPEGCARGYEGPLCAVCSEKYYFASTTSKCIACEGNGQGQLAAMILISLVVVVYFTFTTFLVTTITMNDIVDGFMETATLDILLEGERAGIAAVTFTGVAKQHENRERDGAQHGAWDRSRSANETSLEWLARVVMVVAPKVKTMLTAFQIVSSLPFL
jgi:hypothetical protein